MENNIDRPYKILIVDDEENILHALSQALKYSREFECDIFTAPNGQEALNELLEQQFDLVLADYKMPVLNGVDLLAQIREKYPNTIRMLVTGYSDIEIAKDAINKAQVHNYIGKPWDNDELILTVSEALKRKSERDSENIKVIDKVGDALKVVGDLREKVLTEQKLTFSFDSMLELNKFSFQITKMNNVHVKDFHVFENRYIISVRIQPERYDFTV